MLNHTTHPQGRDSHNLNKYIWRFIALSTAQPRVITIEATSEQEARQQSPDGCVMVFAARIRQGNTMINLSLTDLNRVQFREKFTGQLLVNVDKGRVVCNYHLPDEAIVATRESLQELAERAGMINANIQG